MNRRMMNLQSTIATRMEETPRTSAVFMRQCKEQPQRGQVWTCGSQAETYCTHALPEVPRSYRSRVGGGALARWPPSAAQTARAGLPLAAFAKTQRRRDDACGMNCA